MTNIFALVLLAITFLCIIITLIMGIKSWIQSENEKNKDRKKK
jgi:hypothetical protein